MLRILKSIAVLTLLAFASGCNNHSEPTEAEVRAFFLQSSIYAPDVQEGRLKLNAFKITSGRSRKIADQELYKAMFTANISVLPAACEHQPESDCTGETIQNQDITGSAEFQWDNGTWSKAGLILND